MNHPTPLHPSVFKVYVGLDWADKKHDYCLQKNGSPTPLEGQFDHTPEAIAAWVQQLRLWAGPSGRVAIALETRHGPLVHALMKFDFLVLYPVQPKSLARYREAFRPSSCKDDRSDASFLLDLLLKHRDQLKPWQPDDPSTRELAVLVEHRRALVEEKTALTNRLTAALKAYFPQALSLVGGDLDTVLALDFLRRWPTLEAVQKATPEARRQFFHRHNSRSARRWEQREQLLRQAQPLTTDPAIIQAHVRLVRSLVNALRALVAAVSEYDEQIERLFAAHPLAPVFASLPGAGAALAPRLLVAFGSQPDRFPDAQALACYAGTAPITLRSGQQTQVRWRRARPGFLHQTFVEFAKASVLYCPWAACYYAYHRAKGHSAWSIYRRLAIRWQRILLRCLQTQTPYQEARYLETLKKKQSEVYENLDDYIQLMAQPQA